MKGIIIFRAKLPSPREHSSRTVDDASERHTRKETLGVLATRKFGITCPVCKRFCFLGYVELEEKASIMELRNKLLHDGWKGELARCDYLKCDGEVFCPWNAAVFPR